MNLTRWWWRFRKRAVPWSEFGVVDDPAGVFFDYRARIVQKERTLNRVHRRYVCNALRRAKGFQAWEAA